MARFFIAAFTAAAALGFATAAHAQVAPDPGVSDLDAIQVTADRFAEQVQEVPSSIEVISAAELHARGVNDLRTALSLLGGAFVAPGGDEGPAAAVPGLLGLREVDDFLLLIDGVPAGSVFIPQFAILSFANIARIEVQRGTAPVLWGTTAFAGTINVIHYAAGDADKRVSLAYGTYGSIEGDGSAVLAQGVYRASLAIDGTRDRYSDARSGVDRGHLLMRNAINIGGGELRLDLDANVQHQEPASPRPLADAGFDPLTSVDFNQNPADGKINTNRFQLTGAYDREVGRGSWGNTVALTLTHVGKVQGFFNAGSNASSGPDNATGFSQVRDLTEAYFETHITHRFGDTLAATVGAGELYGHANQASQTFSYTIPGDGSLPDTSGAGTQGDATELSDWRSFAGIYAQARLNLTRRLGLLAGLRLNRIDERRTSESPDGIQVQRTTVTRLSGSVGANWRVWQDREGDLDDVVLYAGYGNTFQPPQIDFGPDVEGPLLQPETEHSYEAGIKADGFDGRFSADLGLFRVDFANQAVPTVVGNTPSIVNGGRERFKGAEIELRFRLLERLSVTGNYSYNDARYRDFRTVIYGDSVQLAGNRLLMSPGTLGALGLLYSAPEGIQASVVTNYVGRRFLDMQNALPTGSYVTVDATLGYALGRYAISINGYNLGDRREPVLESELGEGQFYLLPGRRVFLKGSVAL